MSNEEYQSLIRLPGAEARRGRLDRRRPPTATALAQAVADVPDDELPGLLADLGGHDLQRAARRASPRPTPRPTRPAVVFAYTIKGWGLPFAGDPLNHSALLTDDADRASCAAELGVAGRRRVGRLRRPTRRRAALRGAPPSGCAAIDEPIAPPPLVARADPGARSACASGRRPRRRRRSAGCWPSWRACPGSASGSSRVAPDVAVSTNLGGWINKVGVFCAGRQPPTTRPRAPRLLRWQPGPARPAHRARHLRDEPVHAARPVRPLVRAVRPAAAPDRHRLRPVRLPRPRRAHLRPLRRRPSSIFAGTPSGVSLAPGGRRPPVDRHAVARASSCRASIFYEPAFAREVEWTLLEALRQCCDREHGSSTYLRLSTKPIDQALHRAGARPARRGRAAAPGAGRRLPAGRAAAPTLPIGRDAVQIAAAGAMVPGGDRGGQAAPRGGRRRERHQRHQPGPALSPRCAAARRAHVRQRDRGARRRPPRRADPARRAPRPDRHRPGRRLARAGLPRRASSARRSCRSASTSSASPARRADLYRDYGIDAESIVNAALVALELEDQD